MFNKTNGVAKVAKVVGQVDKFVEELTTAVHACQSEEMMLLDQVRELECEAEDVNAACRKASNLRASLLKMMEG